MRNVVTICVAVTMIFAAANIASAVTFTVSPADLADGPSFDNGHGGLPFGYDPDSIKPTGIGGSTGAPGYENGCFWSDVQGSAAGGGTAYTAIRLSPKDIFGVSSVTIGQLTDLSYWTKWVSDLDWQVKIYTEPITTGWYGHRFNFDRPTPADNNWNEYSIASDLQVDWIYGTGTSTYPSGLYLGDLSSGYGSEQIMFIDIISSYMTDSPPGDSFLDGIELTIDQGNGAVTANISLVPEPATICMLGLGALSLLRRKRKA